MKSLLTFVLYFISCFVLVGQDVSLQEIIRKQQLKIDSLQEELGKSRKSPFGFKPKVGCYFIEYIQPMFELVDSFYYLYNGKEDNPLGTIEKQIMIHPGKLEWINLDRQTFCPDHHYSITEIQTAWCNREFPAQYRTRTIVTDTALIKDYVLTAIPTYVQLKEGYLTDWIELDCSGNCGGNDLIANLQEALKTKGYDLACCQTNIMDKLTKNALIDFQKKNSLPIGNLNLETLKALGIKR